MGHVVSFVNILGIHVFEAPKRSHRFEFRKWCQIVEHTEIEGVRELGVGIVIVTIETIPVL